MNRTLYNTNQNTKRHLMTCLVATFIWAMLAHAYVFLHNSFSHDSINEFDAAVYGDGWKISLGRVFVPLYRAITRSTLTLPWLIGILSILWIGLAVFFTARMFCIFEKILIGMTAGIFVANLTVIAQAATYINDLDNTMCALLLATIAAFLWSKYKWGYHVGALFVCLSMGLYQSYIAVTITLVIMFLILELLRNEECNAVIFRGAKAIVMLLEGGLAYWLSTKCIQAVTRIPLTSGKYNSMDNILTILTMSPREIIDVIVNAYIDTFYQIFISVSSYPKWASVTIHILAFGIAGILIIQLLATQTNYGKIKRCTLTVLLISLLPLGMNITSVLTNGMCHDLMRFAFWLAYLFVILVAQRSGEVWPSGNKGTLNCKGGSKRILIVLVFVLLWGNVQTSNAVYLKKNIEQQANLSLFTRILYEMETTEGYIAGQTPVVFIGKPDQLLSPIEGFEKYKTIVGLHTEFVFPVRGRDFYQRYFEYALLNPAVIADEKTWKRMHENEIVTEMPSYPDKSGIQMIEGNLVVKIGVE